VIFPVIERLCTLSDHQFPALCAFLARRDALWRMPFSPCAHHQELRKSFLSGMNDLPFVPGPVLAEQQVLAREYRSEMPVQAKV
jgi:hypothetical protein